MVGMETCRFCPAAVVWLKSDSTGGFAPIDATPDAAGNITIDLEARRYHVLAAAEQAEPGTPLHLNHFVTCLAPPRDPRARR